MTGNLDDYRGDLTKLAHTAELMELDLALRHKAQSGVLSEELSRKATQIEGAFEKRYQRWYTEAHAVIALLIPARLDEFVYLYKGDGKRRSNIDAISYNIQDWVNGIRAGTSDFTGQKIYDDFAIVSMRFKTQMEILKSANAKFESSLLDIRQVVQACLFDSELDAARELARSGFGRGAGVIAGVVLERHLAQVASNHKVTIRKKHPGISDWNDLLKNKDVLEVPQWRQIQHLADIRNLCGHNKGRNPNADEIVELIDGVAKVTKTVF